MAQTYRPLRLVRDHEDLGALLTKLYSIARKAGVSIRQVRNILVRDFGVRFIGELFQRDALEFATKLVKTTRNLT